VWLFVYWDALEARRRPQVAEQGVEGEPSADLPRAPRRVVVDW